MEKKLDLSLFPLGLGMTVLGESLCDNYDPIAAQHSIGHITSLTLAAMTGYARVKAGKHYPTDVIAAAAVGFAIGYLIPTLHKKKKGDQVSLVLLPDRIGLSLQF